MQQNQESLIEFTILIMKCYEDLAYYEPKKYKQNAYNHDDAALKFAKKFYEETNSTFTKTIKIGTEKIPTKLSDLDYITSDENF